MHIQWHTDDLSSDRLILAGDIGATNTNLAWVADTEGQLRVLGSVDLHSAALTDFTATIAQAQQAAMTCLSRTPDVCCIAAAGPVDVHNCCNVTNVDWSIDGNAVAEALRAKTVLINDFTAVCASLPLLNVNDPEQVVQIPHTAGPLPPGSGGVSVAIGAGTGLGVGVLVQGDHGEEICASEGGHAAFPAFDEETRDFVAFAEAELGCLVEKGDVLSGRGLAQLFRFCCTQRTPSVIAAEILALPQTEQPAAVSAHVDDDRSCARALEIFARIYGRAAADMALTVIPTRGLYLAGGVAAKNLPAFLDGNFMQAFEEARKPGLAELLASIPVYVMLDYSVSLLGAARYAQLHEE